jgi:hypothetical protein
VKLIQIVAPTLEAHKAKVLLDDGTDISEYVTAVHIDLVPGEMNHCTLGVVAGSEIVAELTDVIEEESSAR